MNIEPNEISRSLRRDYFLTFLFARSGFDCRLRPVLQFAATYLFTGCWSCSSRPVRGTQRLLSQGWQVFEAIRENKATKS